MKKLDYSVIEMTNNAIFKMEQKKKEKKETLLYSVWAYFLIFSTALFLIDLFIL